MYTYTRAHANGYFIFVMVGGAVHDHDRVSSKSRSGSDSSSHEAELHTMLRASVMVGVGAYLMRISRQSWSMIAFFHVWRLIIVMIHVSACVIFLLASLFVSCLIQIRRLKADVLAQLPSKTRVVVRVALSPGETATRLRSVPPHSTPVPPTL